LMWVEEMVCSIYRNTAHVTRLYKSSDSSQPCVLHGNTCAHEMNVVSTAECLPRLPSNVNGMLSIVFVGPQKFCPKKLGDIFYIRKEKVWSFPCWLKMYHILYCDIPIDQNIMDLHPDRGILPGFSESVLSNVEPDADSIFLEETAGFPEQPVDVF
ncbi:hypothetical protein K439DRAFT_1352883, partial [Ramaria rubella]